MMKPKNLFLLSFLICCLLSCSSNDKRSETAYRVNIDRFFIYVENTHPKGLIKTINVDLPKYNAVDTFYFSAGYRDDYIVYYLKNDSNVIDNDTINVYRKFSSKNGKKIFEVNLITHK